MVRVFLALVLLAASIPEGAGPCSDGVQPSGALYRFCMPEAGRWNGDLVVFAHGYVDPNLPVGIQEELLLLPDGTSIAELVNDLGYAFATTSYSTNGLALLPGIADILELVEIFRQMYPSTQRIYLTGASQGGLITTLAVEQNPQIFSGGLAACGPTGDFRKQLDYWGDFRVAFDYFFPGVLPPSPVAIPQEVMEDWETVYTPAIQAAMAVNPDAVSQLLSVTDVPADASDSAGVQDAILGLLWYNAFATNNGIDQLGGQPFDNTQRVYTGSADDLLLNQQVQRFSADPAALAEIETQYQTSGKLEIPLVTLHTTGDPIIPYWHNILYLSKVITSGSGKHYDHIPIPRYGHCEFTTAEVLAGFALLVLRTTGEPIDLSLALSALPDEVARAEFLRLYEQIGEW